LTTNAANVPAALDRQIKQDGFRIRAAREAGSESRSSCRQRGYTLYRRDEEELMLRRCRLLGLANPMVRFQGWHP
jgi:hypothetical protein